MDNGETITMELSKGFGLNSDEIYSLLLDAKAAGHRLLSLSDAWQEAEAQGQIFHRLVCKDLKDALGMSRSSFRCFGGPFIFDMLPQSQGLFEHDEAGRVGIVENGAVQVHSGFFLMFFVLRCYLLVGPFL